MIEIMPGMPERVAAFKALGKVTKQDYESVVIPAVNNVYKKYGKINFMLELDTDVKNFSAGAWSDDILMGLKHIAHWHKVAIVSEQSAIKKITDIFGHLVPGKYKGFMLTEIEEAKKWVAE